MVVHSKSLEYLLLVSITVSQDGRGQNDKLFVTHALVTSSFLLLVVMHLLLVAMHL